jgi:hypothetical protein
MVRGPSLLAALALALALVGQAGVEATTPAPPLTSSSSAMTTCSPGG